VTEEIQQMKTIVADPMSRGLFGLAMFLAGCIAAAYAKLGIAFFSFYGSGAMLLKKHFESYFYQLTSL